VRPGISEASFAGITNHAALSNLGFAESGHTGFVGASDFTQDSGILVGTGAGVFQEETGATLRASIDVDQAGTDNSTDVTLNASATTGGLSISTQEISNQPATAAQNGYATSTQITKLDGIDSGADVTGSNPPQAHKDTHDPQDGSDPLDTAAAAAIAGVQAAAEGSAHTFARADHAHAIAHSIADNALATIDDTDAASEEYAKFTADGLEGRSVAEAKTDLGFMTDVVDDATPQLGGDLEYNENNQVFDVTLTSSGTAAGDIITVTFGESIVFGDFCYLDATDNEWKKALATNAAVTVPCMGMALETKADGASGKLLLRGTVRDDTIFSGADAGATVFLSDGTAGDPVYAAPSDKGDIVQILGFGLAANYIWFDPDKTYIEVS